MPETRKSDRVALITGANKGIGLETARQLGKQGIIVLIGSRDKQRGERAAAALRSEGINAQSISLDVTQQPTIDAAVAEVNGHFGKLDILVNNAAILPEIKPPSESDLGNLRGTFDANFFGLVAVTQAFLPLIRKSTAGRIVNVSSLLGSLAGFQSGKDYFAYSASKVAVNAFTIGLAAELKNTPIKVNAASPGYTATDMNNFRGTQTVEQGAIIPVRLATLPPNGPTGTFVDLNGPIAW
jgi:NAD(P)-dependent dehydrogenase (short-subunit alcohol dehydrogenase family)